MKVSCPLWSRRRSGEHLAQVVDETEDAARRWVYDKDYLINLPLPYSGIQKLCAELSSQCKGYGLIPPAIWKDYAAGQFNWTDELEALAKGGAF